MGFEFWVPQEWPFFVFETPVFETPVFMGLSPHCLQKRDVGNFEAFGGSGFTGNSFIYNPWAVCGPSLPVTKAGSSRCILGIIPQSRAWNLPPEIQHFAFLNVNSWICLNCFTDQQGYQWHKAPNFKALPLPAQTEETSKKFLRKTTKNQFQLYTIGDF